MLYRKREQARRVHGHGVFARFRYNESPLRRHEAGSPTSPPLIPARVRVLHRRSSEHAVDNVPEFRPDLTFLPSVFTG